MLRAFLLAAGLGSRLKPLTDSVPKCAVSIGGKPLIHYWFEQLDALPIDKILVNTHYLPDIMNQTIDSFASGIRNQVCTTFEDKLLGTGGSLLANTKFLSDADTVLIAHADNLCICDFGAFLAAHELRPKHCLMTMMLFRTPTPKSCGVVELDAEGCVQGFYEKVENPPSNLANGAVYLMDKQFFSWFYNEFDFGSHPDISLDIIPKLLGKIYTWENQIYHRDIGTPESYEQACRDILDL